MKLNLIALARELRKKRPNKQLINKAMLFYKQIKVISPYIANKLYAKKEMYKRIKTVSHYHNPHHRPFRYDKSITFEQHLHSYFGIGYKHYKRLIKKGCSICGKHKSINLHHIIPKGEGGTNNHRNLEVLCRKCHLARHNKTRWIERPNPIPAQSSGMSYS